MQKDQLREIAERQMPAVVPELVPSTFRWNVIDDLPALGNRGIELGVAAGSFSARMVASGKFARFWGVDMYADSHNTAEYKSALRLVGLEQNYHLLRMTFDQAIDLFPDNYFDFIYIDGYAHTGEEGGRTLLNWYAKLKPGGIMAGDDYDLQSWPLVVWAVHDLVQQLGLHLKITDKTADATYSRFQSWFFSKPTQSAPVALAANAALIALGDAEKQRRAEDTKAKLLARKLSRKAARLTDTPPSGN
ncbi:class I SAM-dependent methyltransferase [Cypionkella sp.]|uniref:class I SAM-dependent methyltransferase n=1 Tax=Cypionkella sp. TaxID=2811411 RepID=UPI002ABC3B74|nr:class I SAM-dependent methyltransferase [Cypionkella sp.]MDZ4391589.1 class I SAM-dependent methyltransferase [Cypionkella sp.]